MHSVPDPVRVRFVGPLTPFAAEWASQLRAWGYSSTSATVQVQLAAHLSRWLLARGLGPGDLDEAMVEAFLADRRRSYSALGTRRGLSGLLGFLQERGAVPARRMPEPPVEPVEVLLGRFRRWLLVRRGVTGPVADSYVRFVRGFVAQVTAGGAARGGDSLAVWVGVDAAAVSGFVVATVPGLSVKSAQMTACSLRAFLRFAHAEGLVAADLTGAVPAVPGYRLAGLPQALTGAQVAALRDACDPGTPIGRRDLAVIACLHRLALRVAEVAGLRLEDLDWSAGTVRVAGKGRRVDVLPLPVDVGEALVAYLRHGRPATASRTVFVRAVAPFTPLGASSVSCIVGRAARRAGLGTVHAHRLRHTAATEQLRAGATLTEVSLLLRHANPATTTIYAKVDTDRLAGLARPWPTTASSQ